MSKRGDIDPRKYRRGGEGWTTRRIIEDAAIEPRSSYVNTTVNTAAATSGTVTPINTFLGLTDTPDSYLTKSLKGVRVNAGETALEFFTNAFTSLIDTPASYVGQAGKVVRVKADVTGLEFYTLPVVAPGGSNTHVQFNDSSAFGGDARFAFDKVAGSLLVNVPLLLNGNIINKSKELELLAQASLTEVPATGYGILWLKDNLGAIDAYITYGGTSYSLMSDSDTLPQYLIHANVTATGNMTMTANRNIFVPITASTANITLTIPSGTTGFSYTFKRKDSTAYIITLSAAANIDGAGSVQLKTQYDAITLMYDGSTYHVI